MELLKNKRLVEMAFDMILSTQRFGYFEKSKGFFYIQAGTVENKGELLNLIPATCDNFVVECIASLVGDAYKNTILQQLSQTDTEPLNHFFSLLDEMLIEIDGENTRVTYYLLDSCLRKTLLFYELKQHLFNILDIK